MSASGSPDPTFGSGGTAYALDEVRGSLDGALDYLACALTSEADGSLIAALRARRWCEGLAMRVPYLHRGQSVVVLDLRLTEQGHAQRPGVVALVSSWLACVPMALSSRPRSVWVH